MYFKANPIITVAEAKKLLGDEALSMTDEEIQQLISDFDMIAQYSIKMVQSFKEKDSATDKDKC